MPRVTRRRHVAWLLGATVVVSTGCIDVRGFAGTWAGPIDGDPAVVAGFPMDARADPLVIERVSLRDLAAVVTTSDGRFDRDRLRPVPAAAADALSDLTFTGDPLRAYVLYGTPRGERPPRGPVTVVLSLHEDDRVELRLLRGGDLYGVFRLSRVR